MPPPLFGLLLTTKKEARLLGIIIILLTIIIINNNEAKMPIIVVQDLDQGAHLRGDRKGREPLSSHPPGIDFARQMRGRRRRRQTLKLGHSPLAATALNA
mmetsp:Transcript_5234/g.9958  ORF Transcript_5234/g.9958 Transcript_5234/m.9958 type:complete len:100 (-) Transcript_5234:477-776(-)